MRMSYNQVENWVKPCVSITIPFSVKLKNVQKTGLLIILYQSHFFALDFVIVSEGKTAIEFILLFIYFHISVLWLFVKCTEIFLLFYKIYSKV